MRRKVLIVGCKHELQQPGNEDSGCSEQELFRSEIERLVRAYEIKLIAEEWADREKPTIPESVSKALLVDYRAIDIPAKVQRIVEKRPHQTFDEERQEIVSLLPVDKYAKAWSLVREFHMYETFRKAVKVDSSMIVCGRLHVMPLARLLTTDFEIAAFCFGARHGECCEPELDILAADETAD